MRLAGEDAKVLEIKKKRLREKLAELEHEQWAHWTGYMLDNLTDENIERWRRQIDTPYVELSKQEKKSDRVWADKVIELIAEDGGA